MSVERVADGLATLDGNVDGQMSRLDRDDILRACGTPAAASGFTAPGVGTTLRAGGTTASRTMVDEHERLHMELNACTSFGLLLSYIGVGATPLEGSERIELLERYVRACRDTHETYATTLSLSASPPRERAAALEPYTGYLGFLDRGETLTNGFPLESVAGQAFVVAACVAAMQVPLHTVLRCDPEWYRSAPAGDAALTPDLRLEVVAEAVERGEIGTDIAAGLPPELLQHRPSDPYGSREFKDVWHTLLIRIYHRLGFALRQARFPLLPWDGHLTYLAGTGLHDQVVAAGDFADPTLSASETRRLAAATMEASDRMHMVRSAERQTLERAAWKSRLALVNVGGVLNEEHPGLDIRAFAHVAPHSGLHIIVRPVESVIAALEMSADQADYLRWAARGGVLTALRSVGELNGQTITALAVFTSNDEIDLLVSRIRDDVALTPAIVSTISTSCLHAAAWRGTWLTPVRYISFPLLLVDLPPADFLEAAWDEEGVNYWKVQMARAVVLSGDAPTDRLECALVERNGAENKVDRFRVFVGSGVLIANLLRRLADQPHAYAGKSLPSAVGLALSQLSLEEPAYNYRGLEFIPDVSPIEEPQVSLDEFDRWYRANRALAEHADIWFRAAYTRSDDA